MRNRMTAQFGTFVAVLALAWMASARIAGQSSTSSAKAATPAVAKNSTTPRTAWGDPDLQGQWNSQTSTPLQRPVEGKLAARETLSEDEAEALEERSEE